MNKIFQKARGLLGVGLTWGTLWAGIGAGIGLAIGIVRPELWAFRNPVFEWALGMGLYGIVSGVGFGALLTLREGRKTILDLSLRRVALWGVLGAAAVPLFFGAAGLFEAGTTAFDVVQAMLVTASLGGTFAPATVAIARQAELSTGEERKALSKESPLLPSH